MHLSFHFNFRGIKKHSRSISSSLPLAELVNVVLLSERLNDCSGNSDASFLTVLHCRLCHPQMFFSHYSVAGLINILEKLMDSEVNEEYNR